MTSPIHRRVQRALLACRATGLAFPSMFLGITGRPVGEHGIQVHHREDGTFLDARGELDWCAIGGVLDAGLGAACTRPAGPTVRPATAYIQLQMTGAAAHGDIVAETSFQGFTHRSSARQSLAAASIRAGDTLIAYGSAKCVLVDLPGNGRRVIWPWQPEGFEAPDPTGVEFDETERDALAHCAAAEAAASPAHAFIEHFWCGVPEKTAEGSRLTIPVTPHLANRVGNAHGGLLLGTAAKVATTAAPEGMRLSNIAVYYVSPGLGPTLEAHAHVTQRSRRLAVVRTQIVGATGKVVLEATSQHVAA